MPLLEAPGPILDVGRWVLETVVCQSREWRTRFGDAPPIAVNVSVRQLEQDDLVHIVERLLATYGLQPGDLVIELTETAVVHNLQAAQATPHQPY